MTMLPLQLPLNNQYLCTKNIYDENNKSLNLEFHIKKLCTTNLNEKLIECSTYKLKFQPFHVDPHQGLLSMVNTKNLSFENVSYIELEI